MPYQAPNLGFGPTRTEDLCAYLGYPHKKTCGRSWHDFGNKTAAFRKKFTEMTPGLQMGTFPIDVESPVVLECVESFLELNQNLFRDSNDAF